MLPIFLRVEDCSITSEARNEARALAHSLGFQEEGVERAAIVASEACTNLLKHAGGGSVFMTPSRNGVTLELLALDKGPGMANLRECLRDGFSTAGTPGNGLGAIGRLSSFSDIYSQPGRGTVLYSVISNDSQINLPAPRMTVLRVPKPGEAVCGDNWELKQGRGRVTFMVADGLGHGPNAAEAAHCAAEIVRKHADAAPKDLLESVHQGLRHTRGAAVSIVELDEDRRVVRFAGLGNVAGSLCHRDGLRQQMVSMNGTAGMEGRNIFREFSYPWPEGAVVVLHSDGLGTRWDLAEYPSLVSRGSGLIAGALFRDYWRGTDDALVAVLG